MRAMRMLREELQTGQVIGHRARLSALLKPVETLIGGAALSVTGLGRGLRSGGHEKHRIKSVDELARNGHLQRERVGVYRLLAHRVLRGARSAVIAVDWSDTGRRDVRVLRAAVVLEGRSFVLWEEVYPESEYNRASTHRAFVETLHEVVPEGLEAVVVTDAGFRAPWFRLVESYGWSWVGRIRNHSKYQRVGESEWREVRGLYEQAGEDAQALGAVRLNKQGPLDAQLFLSREPRVKGHGPRHNAQHYRAARSHREPWVLAVSPSLSCTAEQAMALYATRMQIEQSFRDLKNPRHGFGLRYSHSKKPRRVAILLLIAALATFMQWLAGLAAEAAGWTRRFQANTERRRRVLSYVYLGARALRNGRLKPTLAMLRQALDDLPALVVTVPVAP